MPTGSWHHYREIPNKLLRFQKDNNNCFKILFIFLHLFYNRMRFSFHRFENASVLQIISPENITKEVMQPEGSVIHLLLGRNYYAKIHPTYVNHGEDFKSKIQLFLVIYKPLPCGTSRLTRHGKLRFLLKISDLYHLFLDKNERIIAWPKQRVHGQAKKVKLLLNWRKSRSTKGMSCFKVKTFPSKIHQTLSMESVWIHLV